RAKVIDFSEPYFQIYNGIFGPENSQLDTPAELVGHKISVTRGSTEDLALSAMAPAGTEIHRFEDNNGTLSAYFSKQVDFVATGVVTAPDIMKKLPSRALISKLKIDDEPGYVGLRKREPALLESINGIIQTTKKDGTLNALTEKWLGFPMPEGL